MRWIEFGVKIKIKEKVWVETKWWKTHFSLPGIPYVILIVLTMFRDSLWPIWKEKLIPEKLVLSSSVLRKPNTFYLFLMTTKDFNKTIRIIDERFSIQLNQILIWNKKSMDCVWYTVSLF